MDVYYFIEILYVVRFLDQALEKYLLKDFKLIELRLIKNLHGKGLVQYLVMSSGEIEFSPYGKKLNFLLALDGLVVEY